MGRLFGVDGGVYDFTTFNMNDMHKKKKQLEDQYKSLKRNVNTDVLENYDRYFIEFIYSY